MTTTLEIISEKCDLLLAENTDLRERIRQLEKVLTGGFDEMPVGGLTKTETIALGVIAAAQAAGASKDRIFDTLYAMRSGGEIPEMKIIDVLICKIRKKLAPRGIEIETVWGWGYRMPAESREILEKLREALS